MSAVDIELQPPGTSHPDGPDPIDPDYDGHTLAALESPDTIETGWWTGDDPERLKEATWSQYTLVPHKVAVSVEPRYGHWVWRMWVETPSGKRWTTDTEAVYHPNETAWLVLGPYNPTMRGMRCCWCDYPVELALSGPGYTCRNTAVPCPYAEAPPDAERGIVTWRQVAAVYPEFVQWAVAKFGPLPDGPVKAEDYERFKVAYESRD